MQEQIPIDRLIAELFTIAMGTSGVNDLLEKSKDKISGLLSRGLRKARRNL